MTLEEKYMERFKKAGRALISYFIVACILLAVLFVLEHFTANKYVYFVCGSFSCILASYVLNALDDNGNDEDKS
jgi:hypothetical protein